jgi:RNA polymerase sigma factor (sigma-70 family)
MGWGKAERPRPNVSQGVAEPSDDAVLAGLAASDPVAARVFVTRFSPRAYGLALQLVGDRAVAEDVSQEALLRAWRHAASFDARRGTVATWVLSIVRHLAIDTLRMRRSEPVDPTRLEPMIANVGPSDAPAIAAEHDDDARRLRLELAGLPVEQRRAVVLAAYGGLSASEVATAEQIPLGTAKTRIRAGLRRLRTAYLEDAPRLDGDEQ